MKRVIYICGLLIGVAIADLSAKEMHLIGDVNGDGEITVADVIAMIDHLSGKSSDSFDTDLADINDDGHIDISDVMGTVSIVLGEIEAKARAIDTIRVTYQADAVMIEGNFNPRRIKTSIQNATGVTVTSVGKRPFVCIAEGKCPDGSLTVDADTTCTMILDNLELTSLTSAAISFIKKQKVCIELPKGKQSVLCDATSRDETDDSKACLYSKGTVDFSGKGMLTVSGNYSHGIASSKNISVDGCHVIINNVVKNGIHCDKFTLKKGQIDLHLLNDASKGIKAKEELVIKGGRIEGEASGHVVIDKDDISYSSILKSDGLMTVSGGTLLLKHNGDGGRCISVDKDLLVTAGTMNLECHGEGGHYFNMENQLEYYTSKCITVNGNTKVERGKLNLLATGNGGKGLDSSEYLQIGRKEDGFMSEDSLCIIVETKGAALVDNVDEDYRRGCPKAIKCDNEVHIFSGTLRLRTHGQGGEGIESKFSLRLYNCTISCDCYDDGINTGMRCYIDGAHIFCLSHNNDGIDSNGKISIMNGIVAAISEHASDESFDTNEGQLNLFGGYIIGVGNDEVEISQQSTVPHYSTPSYLLQDYYHHGDYIEISQDKYLTISEGDRVIISLKHKHSSLDSFITVANPFLKKGHTYTISDGEKPHHAESEWFDGCVIIGGIISNVKTLKTFNP